MSYYYINGYSYPSFGIYTSAGQHYTSFDLPLCGEAGLMDDIEIVFIEHQLLSYERIREIQGFHFHWTLSYDRYLPGNDVMKIRDLLMYHKLGYTIKFIPRIDQKTRIFEVYPSFDNLTMGIMKGGINTIGHRGITVRFSTKELQTNLNFIQPGVYTGHWYPAQGIKEDS